MTTNSVYHRRRRPTKTICLTSFIHYANRVCIGLLALYLNKMHMDGDDEDNDDDDDDDADDGHNDLEK